MKNCSIESIRIWFKDEENIWQEYNYKYFGIALAAKSMLDLNYTGAKIKIINLYFGSKKFFELYPNVSINATHYYNGYCHCYLLFDYSVFDKLKYNEICKYLFESILDSIGKIAHDFKKNELIIAINRVNALKYNLDFSKIQYCILNKNIIFKNNKIDIYIKLIYDQEEIKLIAELVFDDKMFIEVIAHSKFSYVEYLIKQIKDIKEDGPNLVIIGSKNIDFLPYTINLNKYLENL